jgi:hypothetical protein
VLVDLSPGRILANDGLTPRDSASFPVSAWRNLIVAPRANMPMLTQARVLIDEHLDLTELALLDEWPTLAPLSEAEWRRRSARALARGLAYDMASGDESAIERLVARVVSALERPEFLSNQQGDPPVWGWDPLTSHTFDACLVAADRTLICVVFVVDED